MGWLHILPKSLAERTHQITMGALALLLFSMGLSIGGNEEILRHINHLGLKALFIAIFSIIGSVLVIWFLQRRIFRGGEN